MNMLQRLAELERRYDGPIPLYMLSPPNLYALNSARENMRRISTAGSVESCGWRQGGRGGEGRDGMGRAVMCWSRRERWRRGRLWR